MQTYEILEQRLANWASYYNPRQMVVCNSGTAALHLALEALGLPAGSLVVIPDYTMVACARAATLAGLTPVFVDCGEDMLLDMEVLEKCLRDRKGNIRAVMAVHIYGRVCDMPRLHYLASEYRFAVVEDLAEAHGVQPHRYTDAACWSFYRNKIVHGEEGGAVAFRDTRLAEKARRLRCLGFTEAHDFRHIPRGHNYRLANCLAELIIDSLNQYEENAIRRRKIESWFDEVCPDGMRLPPRAAVWVYDMALSLRNIGLLDEVVRGLARQGIEARHGFKPMSIQEEYRQSPVYRNSVDRHVALERSSHVFYLPFNPSLVTRSWVEHSIQSVEKILN